MHSLDLHKELERWSTGYGGHIDDSVCIAHDAERGVHMQVKVDWPKTVEPETRAISAPLGITMSYYNAIEYKSANGSFSNHDVALPQAFIDAVGTEETFAFFLMGQFLCGPDGFWYPYLCTLPQPGQLNTPLYFDEEDVAWVDGTGIPEASLFRYKIWDEKYDQCITKLEELGFAGVKDYTWELYLWASTIITSRAFSVKVLAESVEASDLPETGISVLLPLIDLPNHRPLAKVEWRAGEKDVGLILREDVRPGEEISNNYGPRNNEQLLMNYGFCIPNNPTDYRIIKLGVDSDSPLSKAKARQIEMFPEVAKNTEDHYYIFNVFYPLLSPNRPMEYSIFSPALFNALAVMHGNERERKSLVVDETGISIPQTYGNGRSSLAALAQISVELIAHIMMLEESGKDLPPQPQNIRQMFAQTYREGLISMDKTALVIATWTITRARDLNRGEDWLDVKPMLEEHLALIPDGQFPERILSQIQVRILERSSLLPKNGQLYRIGELYSLLPEEMQGPSQACFSAVLGYASQQIPGLGTDPQGLFSLVLGILVATFGSPQARPRLSPRLTKWIDFLLEQYPSPKGIDRNPEEGRENIDALAQVVSHEMAGAWLNGAQVAWISAESGWMEPGWLQWAWRVAKEEMVMLPLEPLQVLVTDSPKILKQAVIYVPKE